MMRTVVHEMRNQLAVAVANIEAFIDGKLEPTPRRLQAVLQALSELDVLMNDLRPEARTVTMSSERRVVDICAIITNEVLALEASASERGIAFAVHQCAQTHPACGGFCGDPGRIAQVVTNLLLNAVRYTPRGGHITVDCRRDVGALGFTVANDGAGIKADDCAHVFEAGFRGAGNGDAAGSGIGLAVAKQIVEDHGGTISVRSLEGQGAVFTVQLPDDRTPDACSACRAGAPSIR